MLTSSNFLKFFVEKDSLKSNSKLQLAHVNGSDVTTNAKKIHHWSIAKLGKRKKNMPELIETIIMRAQQNFDTDSGLNPIEIEIKDNILKKYKNATYKIIPLGLLFPASITSDTSQIFAVGKNLNGLKKSILNQKIFDILAIIYLN